MNNFPSISDAEWQVMKVLWDRSPLTSTEIISELKSNNTWSPKTVHTLISRLVKKEAIEVKKGSKFNLFTPIVTQEECSRVETKSFIEKVYNGSIQMMLKNFIKDEKLSSEEIEELRRMLDDK
ncbi:BlaI/MecI/CopY family transcriptional regulator [Clostridium sp. DL1XJH146]